MSGSNLKAVRELARKVHRERGEPPGYTGPCWGPNQDDIDEARARRAGCRAHVTGFCSCGHLDAIAARTAETAELTLSDAWSAAERNRPPLGEDGT